MKVTLEDLKKLESPTEEQKAEMEKLEKETKKEESEDKKEQPTEPDYKAIALRQADFIKSMSARQDQLDKKLDDTNKRPGPTLEEQNSKYWNDPVTTLREVMGEMVKPLYEFKDRFEHISDYDKMKNKLKADPRYKKVFDVAEAHIDAAVEAQTRGGGKIDESILKGLTMGVAGAIQMGEIEVTTRTNDDGSSTTRKNNMDIPPHMRPSPPPAPKKQEGDKKDLRALSETEERMRRENGLTHEAFLELIDLQPHEVIGSAAGKEKK